MPMLIMMLMMMQQQKQEELSLHIQPLDRVFVRSFVLEEEAEKDEVGM